MNKKGKTYVLLAAVLAIWGTIGYKIINGINPDNPEIVQTEFNTSFNPEIKTKTDTFSIQKVEKDPFLGTLASNRKQVKTNYKSKPKTKRIENAPKITYSGLVKKQNSKDQVFVININNKQYLLKKGQVVDSVTLLTGSLKEIIIRYKNKTQTIKRN